MRRTKVISSDCIEVIFKDGKPQRVYPSDNWWHIFLRLSQLEDRDEPKKFIYPVDDQEPYRCQTCNEDVGFNDDYFGDLEITHFCKNCGQRLCK